MFWSCSNIIIPLIWTRSKSVNYLSYCYLSYLNKIIILSHLSTLSEQDHSIISFIYLIWTDHLTYLPYLNKIIVLSHLSVLSEQDHNIISLIYLIWTRSLLSHCYLSYLNKIIVLSHLSILSEWDHNIISLIYLR